MNETSCPFCAGARAIAGAALGTTLVVAACGGNVTACGGTTEPGPVDASADVVDASAAHDAGIDAFVGFDAPVGDAFVPGDGGIALYGAPPVPGSQREKLHE